MIREARIKLTIPGSGSERRSTLPFGVSGRCESDKNREGTMYSGRESFRYALISLTISALVAELCTSCSTEEEEEEEQR
jgi:hypothetical protein